MSKKSTIYTSKKKRTAAAIVCIILVAAMVLALLMAAFVQSTGYTRVLFTVPLPAFGFPAALQLSWCFAPEILMMGEVPASQQADYRNTNASYVQARRIFCISVIGCEQ